MQFRKILSLYAVSMTVGLFTAFVLTRLWEWFVVPAFNVTVVSFWVMYGLTLLVGLFQSENRHKIVAVMLDACVPADRREEIKEQLNELAEETWYEAGWKLFGRVAGNAFTLGLAYVVHVLAS